MMSFVPMTQGGGNSFGQPEKGTRVKFHGTRVNFSMLHKYCKRTLLRCIYNFACQDAIVNQNSKKYLAIDDNDEKALRKNYGRINAAEGCLRISELLLLAKNIPPPHIIYSKKVKPSRNFSLNTAYSTKIISSSKSCTTTTMFR